MARVLCPAVLPQQGTLIFQSLVICLLFHFVEEIITSWGDMAMWEDQAAVLNCCIVPLFCFVLLPNPWPSSPYNGEQARAFLRVGGADSLDFCKSSCPILELCYSLWSKQGLSIVMVQCWFQRIYKLWWIYGEQRLRAGGLHHVAAYCSLWISLASGCSVQQEQVDLRELSFSFWTWRSILPNPVMKQWD